MTRRDGRGFKVHGRCGPPRDRIAPQASEATAAVTSARLVHCAVDSESASVSLSLRQKNMTKRPAP
jgi:hypothetical protein